MASHIERRKFLATLGGAAAWPLAARSQRPGKLPTIGFLGPSTPLVEGQRVAAFVQRLRELGWIDGRDLAIEYRWAEGRNDRYAEIAAEFARLKVDVVVTLGTASVIAAKQTTAVIPIVFVRTRSAAASSRVWRARAATSPACRTSYLIPLVRNSNFCARLFLASGGWLSWPMSAIPPLCWR
jgi:putative tryptophan/tyrosine transport system substrate-binding protein